MKPPTIGESRWFSYLDVMGYFKDNWAKIADIVSDQDHLKHSDPVYCTMEDIGLKQAADDISEFLQVFVNCLNSLQEDFCTTSKSF